ncbi:MAG: lytic transglycosylase domain-containing protein, partial [Nitrospirae bacterium]|nr:lytic transglycosylase domain-containing protein [Nitrospirota bacterium]
MMKAHRERNIGIKLFRRGAIAAICFLCSFYCLPSAAFADVSAAQNQIEGAKQIGESDLTAAPSRQEQPLKDPEPVESPYSEDKTAAKNSDMPLGIFFKSRAVAEKAVEKNLYHFKDRMKERFSEWLERSARYLDIMKEILKEKGMPDELVFLPIIESGFNPHAYSRARAVGPWQFMAATGKKYGLKIDWWRDERKDPVKSTYAAANYLKDLYGMFDSWKLALAAYNAGEGRISKAMRRSGADDYWDLLSTKQIRKETKEY